MLKDILAVLGELFPLALHMVCGRMVIEQARTVSGPKSCCFSYNAQLQFQSQFHNICFFLIYVRPQRLCPCRCLTASLNPVSGDNWWRAALRACWRCGLPVGAAVNVMR